MSNVRFVSNVSDLGISIINCYLFIAYRGPARNAEIQIVLIILIGYILSWDFAWGLGVGASTESDQP